MADQIRLLLADDQQMVRAGFRLVLDAQPDMEVLGEVGDGVEAVAACRATPPPDVVLMDIRMPRMDGIAATERIVAANPDIRVLVLTTFDLDEYVYAALRAGASGFLLKDAGPHDLLAAIRAVHAGDAVVAPAPTRRLIERVLPGLPSGSEERHRAEDRPAPLTAREREVLIAVGQGFSNTEIAEKLFVAEATIKTHIGNLLAKLGVRDRVHLVIAAYDAGLVVPRG
ncbi:response regulator transcription factor [Enemella evansiae]|uniref:response regulator transcription factor n=1 Tax=Enemella evansiae TaxID=2016499 RepID=UPI000B975334|nr:response regulator transcription factor [Enemella evansiae]OYO08430.1 DNA-binding response regulator [Enemella evansiae]TDO93616.1 LuxR family two component transcriptional regulator [Enemella evansiae]